MTVPDNTDALRVGDRERELAIGVLHDAVGGGYLDLHEFEERSGTVYAARTRGDLRAALADLPAAAQLFPPAVAAGSPAALEQAVTMEIDWTTVKRRGAWSVPGRLVITGAMGTADLDFRDATIPATGCVVEVATSWSTVRIRLADSVVTRTQEFAGGSMSTLKDRAGPPKAPNGPLVDLRGHPDWTTLVLRRG